MELLTIDDWSIWLERKGFNYLFLEELLLLTDELLRRDFERLFDDTTLFYIDSMFIYVVPFLLLDPDLLRRWFGVVSKFDIRLAFGFLPLHLSTVLTLSMNWKGGKGSNF